jgi:pimeloyl-ACP methyl ester carboxylesterase
VRNLVLVSTGARTFKGRWRGTLLDLVSRLPISKGKYRQLYFAFQRQRRAVQDYDATGRLADVTVPTLVLRGRRDWLAPYSLAREMHTAIKGSRMVAFPGGHLFFVVTARRFVDAIVEFIRSGQTASI